MSPRKSWLFGAIALVTVLSPAFAHERPHALSIPDHYLGLVISLDSWTNLVGRAPCTDCCNFDRRLEAATILAKTRFDALDTRLNSLASQESVSAEQLATVLEEIERRLRGIEERLPEPPPSAAQKQQSSVVVAAFYAPKADLKLFGIGRKGCAVTSIALNADGKGEFCGQQISRQWDGTLCMGDFLAVEVPCGNNTSNSRLFWLPRQQYGPITSPKWKKLMQANVEAEIACGTR